MILFQDFLVLLVKTLVIHLSHVKQICVFEHSVMTNCNCACPAIQRGQGSGFLTARMRRLAWTFAACIDDKYQIRLTRPIYENSYCENLSLCTKLLIKNSANTDQTAPNLDVSRIRLFLSQYWKTWDSVANVLNATNGASFIKKQVMVRC